MELCCLIRKKLKTQGEKKQMAPKTSSIIYFPLHTDRNLCPHDIMSNIFIVYQLFDCWILADFTFDVPSERFRCDKTKQKKLTADTAEWCGILVWTQFSAVCLLSCRWQPGWGGEAFCLRPAGSGLVGSFGRPHLLQTSAQAGLTNVPLQAAFMCHLMRKPPA